MGILDRYICRRYALRLAVGLAAFLGAYLVIELFGHLSDIVRWGWNAATVARYLALLVPTATVLVLPTASLVATASLLGALWHHNELPALLLAGRSRARVVAPVLATSALVSLGAALISEQAVPATMREVTRMRAAADPQENPGPVLVTLADGTVFHAGSLDAETATAQDVAIWRASDGGETYLWAREAVFEDGAWTLHSGVIRRAYAGSVEREPFQVRRTGITATPLELKAGGTPPHAMSFAQLRRYIESIPGPPPPAMLVELYLRTSLPCASLVLTLVGCAMALRRPAGGELAALGSSLVVSLLYFLLLASAKEMWRTAIPPIVLAWAPNLVFAAAGAAMLSRTAAPE